MATASHPLSPLSAVLAELGTRVASYRIRGINEQATKNALIGPLLNQLGWDIHDLDKVTPEWRPSLPGFRGNPVDYALLAADGVVPVALVEAKALGERLDLHASQAAAYAQQAGVEWAILTNGDEWRVYRAGGWGRGTALPSWLVLRCTLGEPGAASMLARVACAELRDGAFGRWARTQEELRALKAAFDALAAEPAAGLAELLGRELPGGAARVRALWPQVRVTMAVDGAGPVPAGEPGLPIAAVATAVPVPMPSVAAADTAPTAASIGPVERAATIDGFWVSAATRPVPGSKPYQVKVLDQVVPVRSWAELLQVVAQHAATSNPARFALALRAPEFAARKSRRLGEDTEGMRKTVAVGGGYLELNLSAGDCVEVAREIAGFVAGCEVWYSVAGE